MVATTITKKAAAILYCTALTAAPMLLSATAAQAQSSEEAPGVRNVTVVTLYSESRNPGAVMDEGKHQRPPIQIVDGGVNSAGPSCWNMSPSGQIVPVAGECYILRSAGPAEKQPAR